MTRLRNKLIVLFLVATLAPLGITLWITTSLLEASLSYASTEELDEISQSLETTGREFYQRAKESIKADVATERSIPKRFGSKSHEDWPAQIQEFALTGEPEGWTLSGDDGDRLNYLVRQDGGDVLAYSRKLGPVGMNRLSRQYRKAREFVERSRAHDLRRGLTSALMLTAAGVWLTSLAVLMLLTRRMSRPMESLTTGLRRLAAGEPDVYADETGGSDETSRAIIAFNDMSAQLSAQREKLVYMARLESWQALARKMAHEVKNSLTPIRLTMEEVVARRHQPDPAFLETAGQIVVEEVCALERRVRAFSEYSAEPPVRPSPVDLNALVQERVAFLKAAHPDVLYVIQLDFGCPRAVADPDLVKGILTNLLENAAHAAGGGGTVRGKTFGAGFEVHDSGPGLPPTVEKTLFEPTISFKKGGMGLGLSIARRGALLCGGDIEPVKGELGGAAFRVVLPPDLKPCPVLAS